MFLDADVANSLASIDLCPRPWPTYYHKCYNGDRPVGNVHSEANLKHVAGTPRVTLESIERLCCTNHCDDDKCIDSHR